MKVTLISIVLSLAISFWWSLHQLNTTILNEDLTETIFIRQPQGSVIPFKPDYVCLFKKSLYGLKQAPKTWYHKLSSLHGVSKM